MALTRSLLATMAIIPICVAAASARAEPSIKVAVTSLPSVKAPIVENRDALVIGFPGFGLMVMSDPPGRVIFSHDGFASCCGGFFKKFTGRVVALNLPGMGIRNGLETTYCGDTRPDAGGSKTYCGNWFLVCTKASCLFVDAKGNKKDD